MGTLALEPCCRGSCLCLTTSELCVLPRASCLTSRCLSFFIYMHIYIKYSRKNPTIRNTDDNITMIIIANSFWELSMCQALINLSTNISCYYYYVWNYYYFVIIVHNGRVMPDVYNGNQWIIISWCSEMSFMTAVFSTTWKTFGKPCIAHQGDWCHSPFTYTFIPITFHPNFKIEHLLLVGWKSLLWSQQGIQNSLTVLVYAR